MKAGVLFAQDDLRYVDWAEPRMQPGSVKVRVHACGICGSDVPRVLGTEARFFPLILGHEFAGEIVEVASDVDGRAVGDRVAGVPLLPCMTCDACQRGLYALCKQYGFIGSRSDGAFAEYVVVPASNVVPIADGVSYTMGALFEPASVALHGLQKADFRPGEDVVILGTGNIGILTMQWARICGARRVAVCDILPERLELARQMGADAVFNPTDANFADQIAAYTSGQGFHYVFETAGQPATIQLGFELAGVRGTLACIGTPHKDFAFAWKQWELLNRKELNVTGTWMSYSAPFPGSEWTLTAHHFAKGDLKLHDSMIYQKVPLSQIAEAFSWYKTPGLVTGKIIINCAETRT